MRTDQFLDSYLDNIYNILILMASQKQLLDIGFENEAIEQLRLYGEKIPLLSKRCTLSGKTERFYAARGCYMTLSEMTIL